MDPRSPELVKNTHTHALHTRRTEVLVEELRNSSTMTTEGVSAENSHLAAYFNHFSRKNPFLEMSEILVAVGKGGTYASALRRVNVSRGEVSFLLKRVKCYDLACFSSCSCRLTQALSVVACTTEYCHHPSLIVWSRLR